MYPEIYRELHKYMSVVWTENTTTLLAWYSAASAPKQVH